MIMPRGANQLLLPVRPWFIVFSLLVALLIDMVPVGRQPWWPSITALVLVFWNVHQPRRVAVGWAFVLGLLIDVHQGALLGQHGLAFSLLAFLAVSLHRRLLWFGLLQQAVQVLPLLALAHGVQVLVRMVSGGMTPGWGILAAPLIEAALWPIATWLLLAPQRRAPDRDAHRPL